MEPTQLIIALVIVILALVGLLALQQSMYHKMISELSLKIMSGTGDRYVVNRSVDKEKSANQSKLDPDDPNLVDLDSVPDNEIDGVIESLGR